MVLLVHRHHVGILAAARTAPRGPEVNQHHLAAQVGELAGFARRVVKLQFGGDAAFRRTELWGVDLVPAVFHQRVFRVDAVERRHHLGLDSLVLREVVQEHQGGEVSLMVQHQLAGLGRSPCIASVKLLLVAIHDILHIRLCTLYQLVTHRLQQRRRAGLPFPTVGHTLGILAYQTRNAVAECHLRLRTVHLSIIILIVILRHQLLSFRHIVIQQNVNLFAIIAVALGISRKIHDEIVIALDRCRQRILESRLHRRSKIAVGSKVVFHHLQHFDRGVDVLFCRLFVHRTLGCITPREGHQRVVLLQRRADVVGHGAERLMIRLEF